MANEITEYPHQAVEDFSEQLVVQDHLLGQLPPLLAAPTHQLLLHQGPDVLHHHQPLGLLLQPLQPQGAGRGYDATYAQ